MSTETVAPPAAAGPAKTRAQALRSFKVADFPALTGREEEWRFTPLKRLRGLVDAPATDESAHWPAYQEVVMPDGVSISQVGRADARIGSVLVEVDSPEAQRPRV